VFCSFNHCYKFQPTMFAIWMRLLREIEGSVLWLLGDNPGAVANLRREAQRSGIDPSRLVFAGRVDLPEHLARQQLADLFLDTLPYNAGATASAALWAGVPLLTCLGSNMVGRMAASMLRAVGVSELAAATLDDYEGLALMLARDQVRLLSLRERLKRNRHSYPLFDLDRLCRHLESAYTTMWERWRRGERPQEFSVAAVD
jgi:predicted O-linked N-acetylglucosamine transferase (SPINDLY family)